MGGAFESGKLLTRERTWCDASIAFLFLTLSLSPFTSHSLNSLSHTVSLYLLVSLSLNSRSVSQHSIQHAHGQVAAAKGAGVTWNAIRDLDLVACNVLRALKLLVRSR